jgi:hypothetical protein
MLRAKEHTPIPCPFVVFTLDLKIESIKEIGVRHRLVDYPMVVLVSNTLNLIKIGF